MRRTLQELGHAQLFSLVQVNFTLAHSFMQGRIKEKHARKHRHKISLAKIQKITRSIQLLLDIRKIKYYRSCHQEPFMEGTHTTSKILPTIIIR